MMTHLRVRRNFSFIWHPLLLCVQGEEGPIRFGLVQSRTSSGCLTVEAEPQVDCPRSATFSHCGCSKWDGIRLYPDNVSLIHIGCDRRRMLLPQLDQPPYFLSMQCVALSLAVSNGPFCVCALQDVAGVGLYSREFWL